MWDKYQNSCAATNKEIDEGYQNLTSSPLR